METRRSKRVRSEQALSPTEPAETQPRAKRSATKPTSSNSKKLQDNIANSSSSSSTPSSKERDIESELSCPVCLNLCYEPCTTPCAHNFCKECLCESVKSCGPRCPKCRNDVGDDTAGFLINTAMWNAIQIWFPTMVEQRKEEIEARKKELEEAAKKRGNDYSDTGLRSLLEQLTQLIDDFRSRSTRTLMLPMNPIPPRRSTRTRSSQRTTP